MHKLGDFLSIASFNCLILLFFPINSETRSYNIRHNDTNLKQLDFLFKTVTFATFYSASIKKLTSTWISFSCRVCSRFLNCIVRASRAISIFSKVCFRSSIAPSMSLILVSYPLDCSVDFSDKDASSCNRKVYEVKKTKYCLLIYHVCSTFLSTLHLPFVL